MLQLQVVEAADDIIDNLNFSGKRVVPKNATPVNNLVSTLIGLNNAAQISDIVDQSVTAGTAFGSHGAIEKEIVLKISPILANIINTAKNTINPICRDMLSSIEEARQLKALNASNLIGTIEVVEQDPLFSDEMFLELIAPYKDMRVITISDTQNIFQLLDNEFSDEEIETLCKTGSASLDTKVVNFLAPISFENLRYQPAQIDVTQLGMSHLTMLFLLAIGIENQRIEKAAMLTSNTDAAYFISLIKSMTGCRLYREIDQMENANKAGMLIVKPTVNDRKPNNSVLSVYGRSYRDWIQNGNGSTEAALGYLAQHGNVYSPFNDSDLREHPEKYAQIYQGNIQRLKAINVLEDFTTVRETVARVMTDSINAMTEVDKGQLHRKLAEALSHEYHGANNLHHYVIKVVCRTLTNGSDIKDLLLNIDSILVEDQAIEMGSAVNLAIIRLVAKWIASQFIVSA